MVFNTKQRAGVTPPKKSRGTLYGVLALIIAIAIAAAIVIPNLTRSLYMEGYEATGANSVRTLITAEIMYQSTYRKYAPDIQALGGTAEQCHNPTSAHACVLDAGMTNSSAVRPKSGYYYGATLGKGPDTFLVWGVPVVFPNKSYCGVDDGVIRADATASRATVTNYAACKALPPLVSK